ncbi:hypothetical protein BGP_1992 [Beggiatoa sp. PS]|nr:hypothetical protein BGP_1992 [Beggiatoa sp. PS]
MERWNPYDDAPTSLLFPLMPTKIYYFNRVNFLLCPTKHQLILLKKFVKRLKLVILLTKVKTKDHKLMQSILGILLINLSNVYVR